MDLRDRHLFNSAKMADKMIDVRRIGDVDIAVLEREQALFLAASAVHKKRASLIFFANAHTVNTARVVDNFPSALQKALVLNDGVGVDLASRWLYGRPFPANLNGTDFTPDLLDRLPAETRLFLLGGAEGVAERAAHAILAKHGHLAIAGTQHGFFAKENEPQIVDRIRAADADVVLVAMGHPFQELWAAENVGRVETTVMCVGALLDFYAGTAKRAPSWIRRSRLEWVYRLLREPRRLAGRYLIGNLTFFAHLLKSERREASLDAKAIGFSELG